MIYEDRDSDLTLTKLEDLNRMGRYKLVAGQTLKVLDLAGGIGTALMGVMEAKARFSVEAYYICEVDSVSRGIVQANSFIYKDKYGRRLSKLAFDGFEDLPQDLFILSRQAGQVFAGMQNLPNLVFVTVPCTECSVAGLGLGANTPRGQLFRHAATVVGKLMEEYKTRGLWARGKLAPCGWMFETAPMKSYGHEGAVERLQLAYAAVLGRRAWDDDGQKGGTSRRLTEMYTNLGREEDWEDLNSRGRRLPVIPIQRLLRKGEELQTWDSRVHGPAVWPNVHGSKLRVWPKFVRSRGSHQFRAVRKRMAADSLPQWKMAVGVSLWRGQPTIPSAEMQEQALGLWPGYTEFSVREGRAIKLEPEQRLPRLGDMWGRNLITATLDDRVRSSLALEADAAPESGYELGYQASGLGDKAITVPDCVGDPVRTGQQTSLSGTGQDSWDQSWDEKDQGYQDVAPEELDIEWNLETEFVDYKSVLIVPPGRTERIKPPPVGVRHAMEPGSLAERKARSQLAQVLKWLEDRRKGKAPPPEASLPDGDFAEYIKTQLSNPEKEFQPGNLHPYRKIWRDYLEETLGEDSVKRHRKIQALLPMLEKGV